MATNCIFFFNEQNSSGEVLDTIQAAEDLKNVSQLLTGIGVGNNLNATLIQSLVSEPTESNFVAFDNFVQLEEQIAATVCDFILLLPVSTPGNRPSQRNWDDRWIDWPFSKRQVSMDAPPVFHRL